MSTRLGHHVFLSYSHKDSNWRHRILQCLREMATLREIRVFVDQDIPAGANWRSELSEVLGRAQVSLLLVSRTWIESAECQEELRQSLELRERGHLVVWVPLDGSKSDVLNEVQAVGDSAAPLSQLKDDDLISAAINKICRDVLKRVDPIWDELQSRLPNKYRLMKSLEGGATSAVYLAADLSLERRVVVRAVRDPMNNREFDAAVRRAVQIARHAAIPPVFGAWLEQDPHCCVVEFLEGKTLRTHLDSPTQRWDARDAVRLLLRIGEALEEIHARRIHLRDLRPSKILIDDNGNAFLCGLSKRDSAVGPALLRRVQASGQRLTPEQAHYLVPEDFYPLGEPGSEELADQYLLGLVVYETLTCALPPTLADPAGVLAGEQPQFLALEPLSALRAKVPACPDGLSSVIRRMTCVNPRDRFARLAEALEWVRALEPVDLALARESYARCTVSEERAQRFFDSFYARFRAACPQAEQRFLSLSSGRWRRLHALLKEAVLLLFAYADTPPSARGEPNVLTRIAAMHGEGGKLRVEPAWYDEFERAMIQTATELDPECAGGAARPFIEQAWQSSLEPGIRYMKEYSPRSIQARGATKTKVKKKPAARRRRETGKGT